jgi:hypothetical protein
MKTSFFALLLCISVSAYCQEVINPRPLTMAEYEKAKGFEIKNLDQDTYVKFENAYILDRYELRKPYFITGDDKLKKRIDLYKLIAKEGLQELGIMVFYTNENGKVYKALLPNFTAEGAVWNKYFEDIHAIDKIEANFVLKVSYILSKELSFQVYKSINQGKDLAGESGTYGNDICFPGDQLVTLEDGSSKTLDEVQAGDMVITVNPETRQKSLVKVKKLVGHDAKNYTLTSLTLVRTSEFVADDGINVSLTSKVIEATPNHPMSTDAGEKEIGKVEIGEKILCAADDPLQLDLFIVLIKKEFTDGVQRVYNIEADGGNTFLMNGIMVKQK